MLTQIYVTIWHHYTLISYKKASILTTNITVVCRIQGKYSIVLDQCWYHKLPDKTFDISKKYIHSVGPLYYIYNTLILFSPSLLTHLPLDKMAAILQTTLSYAFLWKETFVFWLKFHWCLFPRVQLHQPRLWFITGGYLVKRWFIPAAARARGQSNDLNREILASNLFNCHKEVINALPVPSISRCIHIVYRHKNIWEYQWSNFIYNCRSTFLHYVCCKDALLDCSAPGGERCESLTWVDEINNNWTLV